MIIELDGQPHAYHEMFLWGSEIPVRLLYKTVRVQGATKDVSGYLRSFLEDIHTSLQFKDYKLLPGNRYIYWRDRPEIDLIKGRIHAWVSHLYLRVDTFPQLPDSFWKNYQVYEGHVTPEIP